MGENAAARNIKYTRGREGGRAGRGEVVRDGSATLRVSRRTSYITERVAGRANVDTRRVTEKEGVDTPLIDPEPPCRGEVTGVDSGERRGISVQGARPRGEGQAVHGF